MPLDTEAIARVVAQLVKEQVAAIPKEPSVLEDRIKQLEAQVIQGTDAIAALKKELAGYVVDKALEPIMEQLAVVTKDVAETCKKFAELDDKMPTKAAKSDVVTLVGRMDQFEPQLVDLSKQIATIELKPGPKGDPGEKAVLDDDDRGYMKASILRELADHMPDPIAPNQVQVTEAVKAIYPSIRADILKSLSPIEHKGVHEAGEEYAPGDEVIKGDSTYRAKVVTREAPPHEDWQCIAKSKIGRRGPTGEPGEKGDPGQKGEDGVGWTDAVEAEGMILFQRSDGETFEIQLGDMIANAVAKFMMKGEEE